MILAEMPLRSVRDRVLALRSNPAFSGLDDEAFKLLGEHSRVQSWREGEVMLEEGRPVDAVHTLTAGTVQMLRHGKDFGTSTAPTGIGWLSLLANEPNGLGAVALTPVHGLTFGADVLWEVLEANFSVVRNSLRLVAGFLLQLRQDLPAPPGTRPEAPPGPRRQRRLTLTERVLLQLDNPIYAGANADAAVAMAAGLEEIFYEPGERLWSIGDPASMSVMLDHGHVRCTSPSGESAIIEAPFVLGAFDQYAVRERSYEAVVETEAIAFVMEGDRFLQVLEEHFKVARRLVELLANAALVEQDALRAAAASPSPTGQRG